MSFMNQSTEAHMSTIACASKAQSEAFVSTIMLFQLTTLSNKDDKSYLRLPSTWRQLWDELLHHKKEREDAQSRATLTHLQRLIAEVRSSSSDFALFGQKDWSSHGVPHTVGQIEKYQVTVSGVESSNHLTSWDARASTDAYQRMLKLRRKLPIWSFRDELLQKIGSHQVVVISGETGCGKSTQVPAFLLEHYTSRGMPCKVICTEPRRISAISLAHRVSQELGERSGQVGKSGSLVGYSIRLENRVHAGTQLLYATTGIVLRMLESSNGLDGVTHLILDEVHERR